LEVVTRESEKIKEKVKKLTEPINVLYERDAVVQTHQKRIKDLEALNMNLTEQIKTLSDMLERCEQTGNSFVRDTDYLSGGGGKNENNNSHLLNITSPPQIISRASSATNFRERILSVKHSLLYPQ
jgi:hypothetical protein